VKIAEDFATLQHLSNGRVDLMLGRGNTPMVYPWFGYDYEDSLGLTFEHCALLRRLWRWRSAVRMARFHQQPRDRRAGGKVRRWLLRQQQLRADGALRPLRQSLP
jgi:alkanesulfonate monooxygenase SsuD/methylene tetrahydromethanopterin reductase-like flavin-dependent oxidoreductase (luciferase family)